MNIEIIVFDSGMREPEDRGILLKDILEDDVLEKYFVSQNVINRMKTKKYSNPQIDPDKTGTLNTKNNSGQMALDSGTTFISINGKAPTQRCSTGRSLDRKHNYNIIKIDIKGDPKANQDKAGCLTGGAHSGGNHSDMDLLLIKKGHGFNKGGIFEAEKYGSLRRCSTTNEFLKINYKIRRLTPGECEALQTMPKGYTAKGMMNGKEVIISDSQRYKMLGNGWTRDVIEFLLKFMNAEVVKEAKAMEKQITLLNILEVR